MRQESAKLEYGKFLPLAFPLYVTFPSSLSLDSSFNFLPIRFECPTLLFVLSLAFSPRLPPIDSVQRDSFCALLLVSKHWFAFVVNAFT